LSGAAVGTGVGSMYKNMDRKQDVGHFFFLLDIAAFMEVAEFKRRMDEAIDAIKSCRKRRGVAEILVPGERSHRQARQNLEQGISLDAATVTELKELCAELGVEYTLDRGTGVPPARILQDNIPGAETHGREARATR